MFSEDGIPRQSHEENNIHLDLSPSNPSYKEHALSTSTFYFNAKAYFSSNEEMTL
jgi:hypothetical protein